MKEITDRLKEERIRLGLTKAELGVAGGVKVNAQNVYERGIRTPSAVYLAAVAKIGVDVLYVLTGQRRTD
ncbi:helix-turn-helix transcriptional regulator [Pseudomonas sp. D6002]|uniref:helix-turn-helix domain-containing protein n=1 Tax=unclassified Pseudomonas TaxID=196821 RepID=UPI0015A443AB|nr:helix-turn-helix transcriptional regulator [Pseudomonas sp. B6001]NWB18321.1 helix-turn-helix transcriptional regulator [Pseudomonas sp. D6002]NWB59095.1 helix-turn-helix transcriptional regulator [Pseudomonas sp. F1002]NWC06841.1 helix-turn-helix transcriptional regulator [Pseudomonas sp. G1002]